MKQAFSRRYFLGTAAAASVFGPHAAAASPPTESLRPVLRGEGFIKRAARSADDILGEAQLAGKVSFAVTDIKTGMALEAHDAAVGRPPASVTKAITALYALDALGAEHKFQTQLLATGGSLMVRSPAIWCWSAAVIRRWIPMHWRAWQHS